MDNNVLDNNFTGNSDEIKFSGYAGFWSRFWAKLLDLAMFIPVSLLFNLVIFRMNMLIGQIMLNIFGLFYQPIMEWRYGATLGKMVVGIRVTNDKFERITLEQSYTRSVFYVTNYIYIIILYISHVYNGKLGGTGSGSSDIIFDGEFIEKHGMFGYLAVIISFVILISWLLVAFDERKQSLHDKIAKTYCVMN